MRHSALFTWKGRRVPLFVLRGTQRTGYKCPDCGRDSYDLNHLLQHVEQVHWAGSRNGGPSLSSQELVVEGKLKTWGDINVKRYREKALSLIKSTSLHRGDFLDEQQPLSFLVIYTPTEDYFHFCDEQGKTKWTQPGHSGRTGQTTGISPDTWDVKLRYFRQWLRDLQKFVEASAKFSQRPDPAGETNPNPSLPSSPTEVTGDPGQAEPNDDEDSSSSIRQLAQSNEEPALVEKRALRRRSIVMPILQKKGWTQNRLVSEAGVGKNSVYDYLNGTRGQITPQNRDAISEALGLGPEELPE